jgi:hypothetical protein
MRRTVALVAVAVLAGGGPLVAQSDKAGDLPYAGKWKLNIAKSDFGESTVTYAKAGSDEMQLTMAGQSYKFKVDGKDYPAILGRTAAWKEIDPNTWETAIKQDGTLLTTDTTKLSADGKTMTVHSKGPKPTGGTFEQTTVYERVSGGPGLEGKWKTKNVKSSAPTVLAFTPSGSDGLKIEVPDFKIAADVKFDGQDYPATGPGLPPGLTLAIKKTGPRSFDLIEKQNGKPLFNLSFAVSADGKTLTETGGPVGVDEKFKAVYDRHTGTT